MVKRIYTRLGIFFLFFAIAAGSAGAELPQNGEVSLNIRFYDKRIYYLESDSILIQVTLSNNGPEPYRFKLAEERAFSLDFNVRTTSNRVVEAADILVRKRSRSQQVYFREISVASGESFSFVENLKDYALLDKAGAYVVEARVFPELYYPRTGTGGSRIVSNRLNLTVKPSQIKGPNGLPAALDVETNAVLVREKLPPDEVVSYMLSSRQKEQWEKFFLYLDVEALLTRDAYRSRQYLAESEEGRQRMLARLRSELQSGTTESDRDIVTVPRDFTVERTVYSNEEGTVTVLEYFQIGMYTEKKRYTYFLRRLDDVWTITDYSVINLGTE
jgi:hypothetical protein